MKAEREFGKESRRGFSLLEMMAVVAFILILASIAIPSYQSIIVRAREAVLRDDLFTMRTMIDRFTVDNKRPPASLEELVEKGYLGDVPVDPITRSRETWLVDFEDFPLSGNETGLGIVNVHSGSNELSLEGTPYNSW